MKVVIDAFWLVDGPPSGRMVLRESITAWLIAHPHDELFLVVPERAERESRVLFPSTTVIGTPAALHPLANVLVLPRVARRVHADLIVAQNFAPFSRARPSVVFVHDVLFQTNPRWFTPAERLYLSLLPPLMTRASRVLTSSQNEVRRIRSHNRRVRDVQAVGLGIAASLGQDALAEPVPGLQAQSFLLTVGRLNVRKNLRNTIEAAVQSGTINVTKPLIVVGAASGRGEQLSARAEAAVAEGSVRFLGSVSDATLRWLYEHCRLFLFLSLDEGWGLPPLEAANLGATVLASDRPVFHETLGTGAAYADPQDVAAIADQITALVSARQNPPMPLPSTSIGWHRLVETARRTATD